MALTPSITALSFLLILAQVIEIQAAPFDITKYGGKANGDVTQALLAAWKDACAATNASTITIPPGNYTLHEIVLEGPCKAPTELRVQGTLKAPADPNAIKAEGWVTIQYVDNFTMSGSGAFDGQGKTAWERNDCNKNLKCRIPMNLRFNFLKNSVVREVTSQDSKNFHVNVLGCTNFTFEHFTVSAPESSINTDGIHIGRSTGVNIIDTNIKTGDDCVSIGDGTKQLKVERVTCGPGHGISVGSLGRYAHEEFVMDINVKNCTLTNTMFGIRIKTWPSSPGPSSASGMHFEDIIMNNVGTPVLIDQEYCPYNQCNRQIPSSVKLSNISFNNIRGVSSTPLTVKLLCSKTAPCDNVRVGEIDLKFSGAGGPAFSECTNIKPTITGKQNPPLCAGNSTQPAASNSTKPA